MSRKIKYARLHTIPHVPFAGELEIVFPGHRKVLNDLAMMYDGITLDISFSFQGKKVNLLVPAANVQCMLGADQEEQPKTVKK